MPRRRPAGGEGSHVRVDDARAARRRRREKMVWERVVRVFDKAEEQVSVIEKICEGRLREEYLAWNGRTR